ncbi:MAG: PqqD family protein, partial [Terriglobia bacterium]
VWFELSGPRMKGGVMDKDVQYAKDENIVSRMIEDEMILVPIRDNVGDLESIYTLNQVGVRVWELIDGHRNVAGIAREVAKEFDVAEAEAKSDIAEFIEQLVEVGAIRSA